MGQPELPPPYPQAPQQVPPQQQQPHEQPQTTDRGVPGGQRNKPQGKWERRFKNMGSKMMDSMVRGFGWGIGTAMARSLMNAICGNK